MLILPSKTVPENLSVFIKKETEPVIKFLNGFRNKITQSFQWVICRNDDFSGQAFCHQVVEDEEAKQKLVTLENSECKIENILGNFVLIAKDDVKYARPEALAVLPAQKMNSIRDQIAYKSKQVEENLLLNNFESYEAYKQSGLSLLAQCQYKVSEGEALNKQLGQRTFIVPRMNPQTGDWSYEKQITLKLQKKQQKKQEAEEVQIEQSQ